VEAEELLRSDVRERDASLRDRLPWWDSVDDLRRAVLLSMSFQLGVDGLMRFRRMLIAAAADRWAEAADELRDSLWYGQTHGRAERLAQALASGSPAPLKLEAPE
jgi:lysozyme